MCRDSAERKTSPPELFQQLALKRQALLESIAERKEQEKALREIEKKRNEVQLALCELARLGYGFEKILVESNIDQEFLSNVFKQAGLPTVLTKSNVSLSTSPIIENQGTSNAVDFANENRKAVKLPSDVFQSLRESETPSNLRESPACPSNNGRPFSTCETRPDWLKDLVLDLVSSEEESDQFEVLADDTQEELKSTIHSNSAVDEKITSTQPTLNVNAEIGKIMMRLKVEISRLKFQIEASQQLEISSSMKKSLLVKKKAITTDIETLFGLIDKVGNTDSANKSEEKQNDKVLSESGYVEMTKNDQSFPEQQLGENVGDTLIGNTTRHLSDETEDICSGTDYTNESTSGDTYSQNKRRRSIPLSTTVPKKKLRPEESL